MANRISGAKTKGYLVGYGRPPKKNRFKKGKSGNPSGKPRPDPNPLSVARILVKIGESPLSAKVKGEKRTLSQIEYFARQLFSEALAGKRSARKVLWDLMPEVEAILARREEARQESERRKLFDGLNKLREEMIAEGAWDESWDA